MASRRRKRRRSRGSWPPFELPQLQQHQWDVIGLGLVTSTAALFSWTGYLLGAVGGKQGAVGASSIGLWVAFVLAGAIYAVLAPLTARRSARAVS